MKTCTNHSIYGIFESCRNTFLQITANVAARSNLALQFNEKL